MRSAQISVQQKVALRSEILKKDLSVKLNPYVEMTKILKTENKAK